MAFCLLQTPVSRRQDPVDFSPLCSVQPGHTYLASLPRNGTSSSSLIGNERLVRKSLRVAPALSSPPGPPVSSSAVCLGSLKPVEPFKRLLTILINLSKMDYPVCSQPDWMPWVRSERNYVSRRQRVQG